MKLLLLSKQRTLVAIEHSLKVLSSEMVYLWQFQAEWRKQHRHFFPEFPPGWRHTALLSPAAPMLSQQFAQIQSQPLGDDTNKYSSSNGYNYKYKSLIETQFLLTVVVINDNSRSIWSESDIILSGCHGEEQIFLCWFINCVITNSHINTLSSGAWLEH